ncbi:hypothetical protein ACLOJK_006416 [Asimina triloba]
MNPPCHDVTYLRSAKFEEKKPKLPAPLLREGDDHRIPDFIFFASLSRPFAPLLALSLSFFLSRALSLCNDLQSPRSVSSLRDFTSDRHRSPPSFFSQLLSLPALLSPLSLPLPRSYRRCGCTIKYCGEKVFCSKVLEEQATSYLAANNLLDLRRIDQRVDGLEYNGMMDYVSDVQLMLKSAAQ